MRLSDRDLIVLVLVALAGYAVAYSGPDVEGLVAAAALWAAYKVGRSHPPD